MGRMPVEMSVADSNYNLNAFIFLSFDSHKFKNKQNQVFVLRVKMTFEKFSPVFC